MTYLIDTNVVSETRRRRPHRSVLEWLAETAPHERHLSVLTLGELRRGIERRRRTDKRAAQQLETWLDELVAEHRQRIMPITSQIADRWGTLGVRDPVPIIDGLLAATALVHGWTLVTRNIAEVEGTGVRTLNPFTPQR
jgi:predicted nucleic acid-binding protein